MSQEGNAINLLNIDREKFVHGAPVKSQCARDYYYGEDLALEKILQQYEGEYAGIVRRLINQEALGLNELTFIKEFMYLQSRRTEIAARRLKMANLDLGAAIFEGVEDQAEGWDLDDRQVMMLSMKSFVDSKPYIDDLKVLLVKNCTRIKFVSSDDPSIMINRFYAQRLRDNSYGINNSGLIMMMPLTPQWYAMAYDTKVYTVPDNEGWYVRATHDDDADALNELQYLRAAKNIYFSEWADKDVVWHKFEEVKASRPEAWCKVEILVAGEQDERGVWYRAAKNEEERRAAQDALVHLKAFHPSPSRWLSKLKFRNSVRTYSNGSAAGHVRHPEWLRRDVV